MWGQNVIAMQSKHRNRILGAIAVLLAATAVGAWVYAPQTEAPAAASNTATRTKVPARATVVKDSAHGEFSKFFDANAKRAFFESLPVSEQDGVVKLKDRWLLPMAKQDFTQTATREQVYLQVTRWLKDDEKQALEAQGCRFGGPFTGKTYRAMLEPGAWDRIKDNPLVAGAAPVIDEDKLHQPLFRMVKTSGLAPEAIAADAGRAVKVAVEWIPGAVALPRAVLAGVSQSPVLGERNGSSIVRLTAREIARLASMPEVAYLHFIEYIPQTTDYTLNPLSLPRPKVTPGTSNEVAQGIHGVNVLHGLGLFGNGVRICEIDGGMVLNTHEALTGRVTNVEVNSPLNDHSTHVCGTMIAQPPVSNGAQGMATQATVFSYNFFGPDDGPGLGPLQPEEKPGDAKANHQCIVCNNSWGYVGGAGQSPILDEQIFGDYDFFANVWDQTALSTQVIICKASGNDRSDSGVASGYDGHDGTFFDTPGLTEPYYDCISNWGCSKNVITVGAVKSTVLLDPTLIDNITFFSSIGPSNDGRIKPEVVADGDNLLSSSYDSSNPGNNSFYVQKQGTSMATPVVSGVCALLVEDYRNAHSGANPDPMLIKGALIHTALDLGPAGPDYIYGFGLAKADDALDFLRLNPPQYLADAVGTGEDNVLPIDVPVGLTEIKLTLLWMDPPGTAGSDPAIVNDLDLELIDPSNVTHRPFSLNPLNPPALATTTTKNSVDTVEQIIILNPAAGTWTVRVVGANVPSGPQNYFLLGGASASPILAPTMTAPISPTYNLKPTFSWTPVSGASQYEIRVDDLTTNTQNVLFNTAVAGTSTTFATPLTVSHDYRARARARTSGGITGPWSAYLNFTVQKLATPTVTAPLGTVNVTQPTLIWSAVAGAETYDVTVSLFGGGTVYSTTGISATSLLIPIALTPGSTYQTVVTAKNSSGNVSAASAPGVFTISNNAISNQPVNGGGGGGSSGGGGGNNNSRRNQQPPNVFGPQQQPKKNNSAAASDLTNNKAEQLAGTLNMPVPAAPMDEIKVTKPSFEWSAVQDADAYELMIVDISDEGLVRQVLHIPDLTDTKYMPKNPLPAGRKYRFLVRAYKKDGSSSQVAPMDFSVAAMAK